MELKIKRNVSLKVISVLLSLLIAIMPFFQPKRVQANPLIVGAACIASILLGMKAAGYANNIILTPEQMTATNEELTANLQAVFPDPTEYNKQLNALQNLDNDLKAGKDIDWSKYSGKALYALLKGVVDVVWPAQGTGQYDSSARYLGTVNSIEFYTSSELFITNGWYKITDAYGNYSGNMRNDLIKCNVYTRDVIHHYNLDTGEYDKNYAFSVFCYGSYAQTSASGYLPVNIAYRIFLACPLPGDIGNVQKVPNVTAKTANKIKLPTRLPQTVINNINNYIDGSTENLIINPTSEELPTLPDGYNPNTDDLINLPGYEDVTPDQPGSEAPEPTPTPTPPEPTPEYNGDKWVNPIGDFMDGLLKFMKAAFVPTLSLNLDALNSMPDNLSEKFPFSLPGDLVRLFSVFQAEPVPFAFDWEIDFTAVGAGKIPIKGDLSMFDEYAPLFRNLAFIAFIIGLAWKTFGMFFGGGDE